MAGNNGGGPWGGGDNSDDGQKTNEPVGSGLGGQKIPEIEDIVKKGQEQLRVLMGGKGGKNRWFWRTKWKWRALKRIFWSGSIRSGGSLGIYITLLSEA